MAILPLLGFGCKMPIRANFGEVFGGSTPEIGQILSRPAKGTSLGGNTRFDVYTSRSVKKCDLGAWRRKQKQEA